MSICGALGGGGGGRGEGGRGGEGEVDWMLSVGRSDDGRERIGRGFGMEENELEEGEACDDSLIDPDVALSYIVSSLDWSKFSVLDPFALTLLIKCDINLCTQIHNLVPLAVSDI